MASESTVARIELAREAEEDVLAENAFHGERLVALVRVAVHALRGVTIATGAALAGGSENPLAPSNRPRFIASMVYLAYALLVCVGLWRGRARPSKARALIAPVVFNTVDFGFNVFMSYTRPPGDPPHLDRAAMGAMIFLCFSLARYDWRVVLQGTLFACGSYLWIVHNEGDPGGWTSTLFSEANIVGLGILILLTNRRLRQMFMDLRKRDNLQRFLPGPIAKRLLDHGEAALQPVQREVTVLFVDIRDFTTLSEPLAPRDVLEFLDDFFGHLGQIVKGHDGIVNKFLGDGMLAFWGVPERDPEHARKALSAVLDLRKVVAEINATRAHNGQAPVRVGMGVHSGIVAAGMLGGADQHEYTIIGDAVNVASRVEGLTKAYAVDALVSEATWRLAGAAFRGGRLGEDKVKGRQEAVVIYSLLDRSSTTEVTHSRSNPAA